MSALSKMLTANEIRSFLYMQIRCARAVRASSSASGVGGRWGSICIFPRGAILSWE